MARQSPEEKFLADIFALTNFEVRSAEFFYPCIVIREKSGTFREITLKEAVETALDNLPCTKGKKDEEPKPRFKTVLALRYGLSGEPPKTLKEISDKLGVSYERARQLLIKAFFKIRNNNIDNFRRFLVSSPEELDVNS